MRVLILVNTFPPEVRSAGLLFQELAGELVRKGNRVTLVTSLPRHHLIGEMPEKYRRKLYLREEVDGIDVIRLAMPSLPRGIPLVRGLEHFLVAALYLIGGLLAGKQDVSLVYSPPLTLGVTAHILQRLKGIPFVFNVQDIYPKILVDMGLLKNRILIRLFESIERLSYRKAAFVTVHSDGNGEVISPRVDGPAKVVTVPNWVDTTLIHPGVDGSAFRARHDLDSQFVVSFAGAMGFAQDLDTVVDSARLLTDQAGILFLLVGDGIERERLERKVEKEECTNVRFLPFQSREEYSQVLAASDVSLVSLKKEIATPTVPGKLLSIMAAGRAVVAHLDLSGDAPGIIEGARCGICVEPANPEKLAAAILELYSDRERARQMGANGRSYAEKHFSLQICSDLYEDVLRRASGADGSSKETKPCAPSAP